MQLLKINLLAKENIKKEERKELVWLSVLVMVMCFGLGAFVYFLKYHSCMLTETRISQAQFEISKYESIVKQVEELESTKRILQTKKDIITLLKGKGIVYPRFMEDIMSVMPSGISFKNVTTVLQPDGKITVTLSADSVDNFPIADLITALTLKGVFADIELGTISTSRSSGRAPISSFSVNFGYQRKK